MGCDRSDQDLFTFISRSSDILQETHLLSCLSLVRVISCRMRASCSFYDPTQKFLIRFNERDLFKSSSYQEEVHSNLKDEVTRP